MPWTHDETVTPDAPSGTIRCVSEKHGRDLTITLPARGELKYCYQCWRNCMFECATLTGSIFHSFDSQKPVEEVADDE